MAKPSQPPLPLCTGDAVPWFTAQAIEGNPEYQFDQAGGRPVLLLFAGSSRHATIVPALEWLARNRALFDDHRACFFGVTSDSADVAERRVRPQIPGIRWFFDGDGAIARQFGALTGEGQSGRYMPHWVLLDPLLRVAERARLGDERRIETRLAGLAAEAEPTAPVLTVPRVFDPDFCRRLIDVFEAEGGGESGFMRDVGGVTTGAIDHRHKRRFDVSLVDEGLKADIRARLTRFLMPTLERAFQFKVSRVERYLVACYDSDGGGYFRPHRDDTTHGTAHRRFACSINLNAEEYDGGDLRFPEFGRRTYRAPTGGAVIFSCSLLHEATPVTRGRRYAYLPFFYDEAAARLREEKVGFVSGDLAEYRAAAGLTVATPTA